MSKPAELHTRIFLDSGFPEETKEYKELLGFLDGQTTNPSLVAKKLTATGTNTQLSADALYDAYKSIVQEIALLVPESVSIEVYGDKHTKAEQMIEQGEQMNTWIQNAHIKLPTTTEGLKAAEELTKKGIRVNMTLVFSQEQAAAVHAATKGATKGSVYISPFIGRLDDKGQNGMDLIKNIARMYKESNSHVEVLSASIRSLQHLSGAIHSGSDIITAPGNVLKEWASQGMVLPAKTYTYEASMLAPIPYKTIDINKPYTEYNIEHELTTTGLQKFADDWNALLK